MDLTWVPLAALLLAAGAWDVAWRRVPNALSAALLAAGAVGQLAAGGPRAAGLALAAALGLGVALTLAWSARLLGGGDVKLGTAAAVAVGWPRLPLYLLATALAGGLVALACWAASAPAARARVRAGFALAARGVAIGPSTGAAGIRVPYAAAMAAGALIALFRGG